MRRSVLWALLVVVPVIVLSSCGEELSYDLRIVNNSSTPVERVGIGYTGIASRAAAPPDFVIDAAVAVGQTRTVELTLDPATDYYTLWVYDDTALKTITWSEGVPDGENVLLSKGGSSTCTLTDSRTTCFAGENSVTPLGFTWQP